jgi:2-dehydro-3-deoxygluconokinase
MPKLNIKSKNGCMWDLVSLGEVMLRLDPGDERISTTRHFRAWEGGGEYNVARGLRRCFGMDTAVVTALADNPVGRLVEDLMLQGGVSQKYVRWMPFDGIGRTVRNGLNFTERGFGLRYPLGGSDRGHTAVSQLKPGEIDWDQIFNKDGVRWFHTGGIFCALSETAPRAAQEAMEAAKRTGGKSNARKQTGGFEVAWHQASDPAQLQSKRQRASQISCRTCPCSCEMLIYLRALVLRFSRHEVEDHA